MATDDLTSAIEQSHAALGAILKGDPSVYQALYSLADDVTLGNPFGPTYVVGRRLKRHLPAPPRITATETSPMSNSSRSTSPTISPASSRWNAVEVRSEVLRKWYRWLSV